MTQGRQKVRVYFAQINSFCGKQEYQLSIPADICIEISKKFFGNSSKPLVILIFPFQVPGWC
jgi:hypothetical protein